MRGLKLDHVAWLILVCTIVVAAYRAATAEPQDFQPLVLPGEQAGKLELVVEVSGWRYCHRHGWQENRVCCGLASVGVERKGAPIPMRPLTPHSRAKSTAKPSAPKPVKQREVAPLVLPPMPTNEQRISYLHRDVGELRRALNSTLNQCAEMVADLQVRVAELERRSRISTSRVYRWEPKGSLAPIRKTPAPAAKPEGG